jgi:UDP-N-acetylmuramate: L-alanyl-gamma-D-glutamyl-meso-diaminopimelate ligase
MVRISDDADFMIIEGDEYLTSPLDLKPKFLWYKPNIALISGISWDHINVFKTEEEYNLQFEKFIESIVAGGSVTYNEQDDTLREMVENSSATIRKFPYSLPEHEIIDGVTYLETEEGPLPLEVFGDHNLSNLEGARWICQQLGVDIFDFYEAIATFKGAAKRMERVKSGSYEWIKDFAHAPSKVKATTAAVKKQYSNRNVVAILELHTYSSLNPDFIQRYQGTLSSADEAIVFYDPEALKIKGLPPMNKEKIQVAFGRDDLQVFTHPDELENRVKDYFEGNSLLLLMSSGNYGGINLKPYGG